MCMSDFDSIDEWREQLLEKYRELSGDELIRVENLDTGGADYTPIWLANPLLIDSALAEDCDQASIIDEVQYMAEDI